MKREIVSDRWYLPQNKARADWAPRWVLGIYKNPHDGRERVIYSNGGDGDHKVCLRESFSKWIGFSKAIIADCGVMEKPEIWPTQGEGAQP